MVDIGGFSHDQIWSWEFDPRVQTEFTPSAEGAFEFGKDADGLPSVRLARDLSTCLYDTTQPYLETEVWSPNGAADLAGFAVVADIPENTSIDFQIKLGDTWYQFDTDISPNAWVAVASPAKWSTEAKMQQGFNDAGVTMPSPKTFKLRARLTSTDGVSTPTLYRTQIFGTFEYHAKNDMIAALKSAFGGLDCVELTGTVISGSPTDTLDLTASPYKPKWGCDYTDALKAFNHSDDPTHATDILSSFSAGVVTLAGTLAVGKEVYLQLVFAPPAVYRHSADSGVVASIPEVEIGGMFVSQRNKLPQAAAPVIIHDRANGQGKRVPAPTCKDWSGELNIIAPTSDHLGAIYAAIDSFVNSGGTITLPATGHKCAIRLTGDLQTVQVGLNRQGDACAGAVPFTVFAVPFFFAPAETVYQIQSLNIDLRRCCADQPY